MRNGAAVRVVRVGVDGKVVEARPTDVMEIEHDANFSIAAEASAMLVAYTHHEVSGAVSTRAVILWEQLR